MNILHVSTRSKGQDEKCDVWLGKGNSLNVSKPISVGAFMWFGRCLLVCWFSCWSFVPTPQEAHLCISKGQFSAQHLGGTHPSHWLINWVLERDKYGFKFRVFVKSSVTQEKLFDDCKLWLYVKKKKNNTYPDRRAFRINEIIYLKYI